MRDKVKTGLLINKSADSNTSEAGVPPVQPLETDARMTELSSLLTSLDEAAQADSRSNSKAHHQHQNRMAQSRLGVASSLFTALQARHPATADHCLRVALGCSSWMLSLDLPDEARDLIEIAALLHDVGKIGVRDHVLSKPGKLAGEEVLQMEQHREFGQQILAGCCPSDELLSIVRYAPAWYNGTKHGFDRSGDDLPFGSRMISIVDAFDSMTTDHIYRRALSRERAVAELFEFAGSQFDPQFVTAFCSLISSNQVDFGGKLAHRWLHDIKAASANQIWGLGQSQSSPAVSTRGLGDEFPLHLLENMHDGVLFVDAQLKITLWNRAAERLTGIAPPSILQRQWVPELVEMRDERGKAIGEENCPVFEAMRSGSQTLRRLKIRGRNRTKAAIDIQVSPLLGPDGAARGAAVVLHDASSKITLEERVQSLYVKATRDALTKCANRAEFDRVLPLFVATHLEQSVPCSMIMCDIDHFKGINDTFGHQAGDEALTCFGSLLRRHARAGDLVARYGGEEFVLLCADCDNATATRRAETLRMNVAEQPQRVLSNRCITASFGVTEVQPGDNPETFLRRADRALLQAKDNGRNMVVQLGVGIGEEVAAKPQSSWLEWFAGRPADQVLRKELVTVVPLALAAEKLRGFVADHSAEILSIEENTVHLKIDEQHAPLMRRWSDRPVPFLIELTFNETLELKEADGDSPPPRMSVRVLIRPKRQRDRRRRDVHARARKLLASLKSYLMAQEPDGVTEHPMQAANENLLLTTKEVLSNSLRN
jgi:diguanylate cyclase (GGDEF)-like protein